MKQHLLTVGATLLVAASSFAQSRVTTKPISALQKDPSTTTQEGVSTVQQTPTTVRVNRNNGQNKTTAAIITPIGSTAGNAYTGYTASKHTFAYNPDLNLLVFGHRGGGGSGGDGGQVHYDYSTDGGATWTPQLALPNPNRGVPGTVGVFNTRFPQTCIWNPAGNTDVANAKIVSYGPCTDGTTGGNGWLTTYLAWAGVVGATNPTYAFSPSATAIPAAPGFLDFLGYDMCNLNGGMGVATTRMSPAPQKILGNVLDFWKIVPDANGGFTRSVKFTSSPVNCAGADTLSYSHALGFGPDGNVGYIAHATADMETQQQPEYSRIAILYKTTDAGETWTKQNTLNLRAIQEVIDSTINAGDGTPLPITSDMRIVVDNLGRCHLFTEILSSSKNCQDSLTEVTAAGTNIYVWSGPTSRSVFHFIIDGDNVQANGIYRSSNDGGTFGALGAAYDDQYQAGRSADGTHIFFTANISDPVGATVLNNAPNLFVYAYRTTDSKFMPLKNMTSNTDAEAAALFPRLTPVVMNTATGHKLPITLMNPTVVTDPAQAVEFVFLDGIEVNESDYTNTIANPAVMGTYTSSSFSNTCDPTSVCVNLITGSEYRSALEGKVSFMPNPSSGILNINMTELSSAASVTVTDLMGKTVSTQFNQTGTTQLDLTAQASGIYFVTIKNNEGSLTAKIAVTK